MRAQCDKKQCFRQKFREISVLLKKLLSNKELTSLKIQWELISRKIWVTEKSWFPHKVSKSREALKSWFHGIFQWICLLKKFHSFFIIQFFTHFWQKLREINVFTKRSYRVDFTKYSENFLFFHTVCTVV